MICSDCGRIIDHIPAWELKSKHAHTQTPPFERKRMNGLLLAIAKIDGFVCVCVLV